MSSTLKLNLGCGSDIKEGYVNIDMHYKAGVDVVCDIASLGELGYKDNTVDEIYMKEVLEHVSHLKIEHVLKRCHTLLKPKGKIYIKVPDMEECAKVILSGERLDEIMLRIYGGQQYPGNEHKSGFTRTSLVVALEIAGFDITNVEIVGWNLVVEGIK